MSGVGGPAPRRRLPTKTKSGVFTLPPKPPPPEDDDELDCDFPPAPARPSLLSLSQAIRAQVPDADELGSTPLLAPASTSSQPAAAGSRALDAAATPPVAAPAETPAKTFGGYGGPKIHPKPPSITGPLNASTTPQVQSLPVKRRGSYQSLKRHTVALSNIKSEDSPSVLTLLRKSTHWERFGTILVLLCTNNKNEDSDGVLQMLSAEGYDTEVTETQAEALQIFSSKEVFPDIVLIDCTQDTFNTMQMIKQLQAKNPTVAIMCLGSTDGDGVDVVTALQGGAADFMKKPFDLDELVARIERHVQRQHCIKLELETALADAKMLISQVASAADMMSGQAVPAAGNAGLISVAETDFEEQITELNDENSRLGARIKEMEARNMVLKQELSVMDTKIDRNSRGAHGMISEVSVQENLLCKRVEELERMMTQRL
eukprot:gene25644-11308_t